ncbi:unnamed protein product [Microthlaspi erraticum]|uniref:Arf-GAP domain-containing protein n=1 Tax=Microthlaspi erraticum TaxID=1685480 RepID=A0A6D2IQ99_9BRAS|nr:unnamed protein product [Microthlaspi erraticum]
MGYDEDLSHVLRQIVFRKLKAECDENKVCFDCGKGNLMWASVTFGVFLCLNCGAAHKTMLGEHISIVRLPEYEPWTPKQLRAMICGGNKRARLFFKRHGWTQDGQKFIKARYTSRAADLYRQFLANQVAEDTSSVLLEAFNEAKESLYRLYDQEPGDSVLTAIRLADLECEEQSCGGTVKEKDMWTSVKEMYTRYVGVGVKLKKQ